MALAAEGITSATRPAGCRTLMTMPIGDSPLDAVRRTTAYRAAVWCGRFVYLCGLVWCTFPFVRPPEPAILLTWLTGLAFAIATLLLLRVSGVRFARQPGSLHWVPDRETGRQFTRDLLWRPPR